MESFRQSAPRMLGPEQFLERVLLELRSHALWDALLLVIWPLLALSYGALYLFRSGWLDELAFSAVIIVSVVSGALAVLLRYRPGIPSQSSVASRIDQLTGGKDRFITLATIQSISASTELLTRLRVETASLQSKIQLRRDFPYRLKHSFYVSLALSLLGAALVHLLPLAYSTLRPLSAPQHIRELAEKMAERKNLTELAKSFHTLANQLENTKTNVLPQETQELVKSLQQQVAAAQKRNEQPEKPPQETQQDSNLLNDASATLNSLDQQTGHGQEQQKESGAGGNLQSNLPQDGKGETKQDAGGDGQAKGGESSAQPNKDTQSGNSTRNDAQQNNGEKTPQKSNGNGEMKGSQPDPNHSTAEKNEPSSTKAQQIGEDKGGKTKTSGDVPQGAPPADRFSQGGEGAGSLKNARYIEVRLPEEAFGAEKGENVGTKTSKNNRVGARLPVSNAPLPPQLPDAPAEKQPMPLEYRGIIR